MPALNINSTYGMLVLQDFELVYVDDNYAHIFGYDSADTLMSRIDSFLDLIDPTYHQAARDNYYQQVKGLVTPRGRTFRNIDRYGRTFTVFTIDHLIEWEGKPAVQVTLIDLSMLERAQEQMLENEKKYKRLILSSRQGITVHRDFRPIMVNQAWVNLMHAPSIDYVLDEVSLLDFIPQSARATVIERYQELMSGRVEGAHSVVENICFDGKKRYFSVYDNVIEWDGEPAIQAVIEDVTDKVELEKELDYKAHHDSLTGLWNRNAIYQWFQDKWRNTDSLACILLDIDDFKRVNDEYGHVSGDTVIRCIGQLCENIVSERGIVGRWGGEEFVIFLPDFNATEVIDVAKEIRRRCEESEWYCSQNRIQRTVSIGVAYNDDDHDAAEKRNEEAARNCMDNLIQRADKKLYQAKSQGKNQVSY
ncbi:PAS domain S-box-containing protein/diguanylate cyclase (GGDEF)-like protein [Vibrio sp. ES.051]|uniref:sensor domain-containing diguanylate cyclase n=1 Tax=Vibrio sp. ES.051 TaxID=1761909 RepID=UPI000BF6D4F4|nr:sensor domain-containing diguanylate cyclase [Vibrio sp. ES.051]PFG45432.1 PAS domain S-box-containing protein/diguanylate cyclase (GGDEF)-like protein [Vibrio sp. ES.051]